MLDVYRRNQLNAEHPRSVERRLLAEITSEMISAVDDGLSGMALMPSLHRNRELWSVWSATCLDNDNALPPIVSERPAKPGCSMSTRFAMMSSTSFMVKFVDKAMPKRNCRSFGRPISHAKRRAVAKNGSYSLRSTA